MEYFATANEEVRMLCTLSVVHFYLIWIV